MKDLRYLGVFVLMALVLSACVPPAAAPTRVVTQATTPASRVAVVVATVEPTQTATAAPTAQPTPAIIVAPTTDPTQVATAVSTPQPTQVTAESAPPEPPKRLILPGVKINSAVRPELRDRWQALSYVFPDVARRIKRIEVRRAGAKAWKVSYEQTVIYLNDDYGVYVQADALTQAFAKKAFAYLQRYQPKAAQEYKTWQKLAETLMEQVR
jgi:hypothetical protein